MDDIHSVRDETKIPLLIDKYNAQLEEYQQVRRTYCNKIQTIDARIKLVTIKKQTVCIKNGGHIWITHHEDGMYGEEYTYCKRCEFDK
jgi:hypothetical protein